MAPKASEGIFFACQKATLKSAQRARLSQPHLPVSGNKDRLSFTLFILCKSGFVLLTVFYFPFFLLFPWIQHLRGKLSRGALSAVCVCWSG